MAIYIWTDNHVGAWIYHNPSQGLISLSRDWVNWTTIADKNLWATQVYNEWDTFSAANVWNWYQRWNNYAFPYSIWSTWPSSSSSTQVDASTYGPGNYYSSSTRIDPYVVTQSSYRDSSINTDLWWGDTNTLSALQWPCLSGRHIPTHSEAVGICNNFTQISNSGLWTYLKMWNRWVLNNAWTVSAEGLWWNLHTATLEETEPGFYTLRQITTSDGGFYTWGAWGTDGWAPIRPFKNVWVAPDNSRTVLYQPS